MAPPGAAEVIAAPGGTAGLANAVAVPAAIGDGSPVGRSRFNQPTDATTSSANPTRPASSGHRRG